MKKFDQYVSHLRILSRAFDEDLTNDFIVSGIIDKYYIQFELGWKVLKELLRYEGANQAATGSPREIIKTAYAYYDFIDERHDLPGHGINQWGKLLDLLENAGYSGPALYEIRHVVSEERIISFDEVTENINSLLNGDIK